uniref:NOG C-terminal domain-containing protein n=1 Tax=Romanomermis culicivorax TaxID=13658 RepID=A0A915KCD8_ROMCU
MKFHDRHLNIENYVIPNKDEKYDKIPEIWEGHNIADFVDVDIKQKLDNLLDEERRREQAGFYDAEMDQDETEDDKEMARQAAMYNFKTEML